MKIKVGSSFSGVIATGSFENSRPTFSAETEYDINLLGQDLNMEISKAQKQLHEICYQQFKEVEQQMIAERINKERKDIRFRKAPNGRLYPSVTSILNYDADFSIPPYQLSQYASVGNITHARVREFIRSGNWVPAKELKECWGDIVIITKGDLNLQIEEGDFKAFLEDYPIEEMKNGEAVFNDEYEYCGEYDFIGIPRGGKWAKCGAEPVLTVFDCKRTVSEEKNFCQESAYAKCLGDSVRQIITVPLNGKTKQGYSTPVVSQKLDYYFTLFTNKRKAFRERYGV